MLVEYNDLRFERPGHSTVRIENEDGPVIYIDPWSEVVDREPTDGDIILVTHEDFDHYDPVGIEAVATSDATVAIYEAVDTTELNFDIQTLPYDDAAVVETIDLQTVPAYNDPDGEHVDENGDPYHKEGEGIGLVLTIGSTTVYFPSDTDFLDHHTSITTNIFIPPIGGHYTMDRHEAARMARSIEPELVLPVHYDTFEAIETDATAFVNELTEDGLQTVLF